MRDWVEHVVWWQVYPLGFVGAPPRAEPGVVHRLSRLHNWLDYLIGLGASGLALGPVFASSSHGYDTVDFYRIDPRLGDEQDFADLLEAAHSRGIRVLLDGVFNHVGREFPLFVEAMRAPDSRAAKCFHLYPGGEYEHFEGHRDLVTLNHDSPDVVDLVVDVMCHWLERGADGWRLDAAYAVPPSFWARVLPRVRQRFGDAYVVGEMIHGDYSDYVQRSGLDAVTQYELWKATWSSLNDKNLYELDWTLQRHNALLDHFIPMTFLGNHDVTRIASRITDERHFAHALVLLMTLGGTPSIYAGDEQAFRGVKQERAGGDDEVRPAFPEHPDELSSIGSGWFNLHRDLIGLRRRHPWLTRAYTEVRHLANEQIVYRCVSGGDWLEVALNLGDDPALLPVHGEVIAGRADPDAGGMRVPTHGWAVCG